MGNYLVFQTDFGLADGAVAAMHGVAHKVDDSITVSDLTHDIPPYDIWAASYRLYQTIKYWPEGTVFVSVVDPGVGSTRRSIALKTTTGHIIITPDNGTITHIAKYFGVTEVRQINETTHRLLFSGESHTFHGRDVYAYNGAKLASKKLDFNEIGHVISPDELVYLPLIDAEIKQGVLRGTIDILDIRFGSLWTNISFELTKAMKIKRDEHLKVKIFHHEKEVYREILPLVRSFADCEIGEPLIYVNSLLNIGIAINQDSFSEVHKIGTGNDWTVELRKIKKESNK